LILDFGPVKRVIESSLAQKTLLAFQGEVQNQPVGVPVVHDILQCGVCARDSIRSSSSATDAAPCGDHADPGPLEGSRDLEPRRDAGWLERVQAQCEIANVGVRENADQEGITDGLLKNVGVGLTDDFEQ
jgi:hypothetical protein